MPSNLNRCSRCSRIARPPTSTKRRTPACRLNGSAPCPRLSSCTNSYGTRCSSVLLVERDGRTTMCERRFDAGGNTTGATRLEFASADAPERWLEARTWPTPCPPTATFDRRPNDLLRAGSLLTARARCWLIGTAGLALAAAPKERIEIKIDGVPDDMAANVRSYLTLSRYVTRDDLTDPQVRRLADRAVDEAADALRPFGFYAPTIRSRTSRDDPKWIVRLKIVPGEPVRMKNVDVEIIGAGAVDKSLLQRRRRDDAQARHAPRPRQLRGAQGVIDAHGARSRLPRRHADAPRADRESHRPDGGCPHHARDRRPLRIRRPRTRPGRHSTTTCAGLRAFLAGPAVFTRGAEQHAVRARGQQLFLVGRRHAGRTRPGQPDGPGEDPRRADQAQSLCRERRLRHRHRHPRPVHLGQPAGQYQAATGRASNSRPPRSATRPSRAT